MARLRHLLTQPFLCYRGYFLGCGCMLATNGTRRLTGASICVGLYWLATFEMGGTLTQDVERKTVLRSI